MCATALLGVVTAVQGRMTVSMRLHTWLLMGVIGVGFAGCKKQVEPTRVDAGWREPYALAPGERIWSGAQGETPAAELNGPGDARARIYAVRTGENEGVVRAQVGETRQDLERFTLRAGQQPQVQVRAVPHAAGGSRAVVEYGPVAGAPGEDPYAALLLGWDDGSKDVKVLKRWSGQRTASRPGWFKSGDTSLSANALASCQVVVAKMAKCADQGGFREALFRRLDAGERASAEQAFLRDSRGWARDGEAEKLCRSWAGQDFHSSPLSEPAELADLERDTKLDCTMFGRELDDEGGLPRRSVIAGRADDRDPAPRAGRDTGRTPQRRAQTEPGTTR